MRVSSLVLLVGLSVSVLASGCASLSGGSAEPSVHHVVLCWLKKPGNAEDRAKVIEATRSLDGVDGLKWMFVGPPLMSERPVVDDSFDVAFHISFRDAAALEAYEKDPRHLQLLNDVVNPLVAKIVVHDFID